MSKVSISGDQNGTGNFTIKAPDSNTDRTLTIPDSDGEFLFTDSNGDLSVDGDTFYVDSANNRVGIGTSTPQERLDVDGSIVVPDSSFYKFGNGDVRLFGNSSINTMSFVTNGSEAARIDSNGALLVGKSAAGGGNGTVINGVSFTTFQDSDTVTRIVFDLSNRFSGVNYFEFVCFQRRNASGGYNQLDTGRFLVFISNKDAGDDAWAVETDTIHSTFSNVSVSNNYSNKTITFTFNSGHNLIGAPPSVQCLFSN